MHVIPLQELAPEDDERVGGKAASLGALLRAGFDVPGGFVVPTEAMDAVLEHESVKAARGPVRAALARDEVPEETDLERLRVAIEAVPLDASLETAIAGAYEAMGAPAVAVRSSGTREDMAGASFAGQYETFLDVLGSAAVLRAVRRAWASVFTTRVLGYARGQGGGLDGLGMAVVVQQLVRADVAGVLFTVDPVAGREEHAVIEAVFGLGESLVSGHATGDRFVVDTRSGAVVQQVVAGEPTLDATRLAELAELGARVQQHYGRPMDVEWTLSGGRFALVQARPITTIAFTPELGEWTTADFRDGGVSSGVCSPFMWSLYELALETSFPEYFASIKLVKRGTVDRWSRMFFARPYWNMGAVKRALARLPGYDEDGFHADLGIPSDPNNPGKKTPVTPAGLARAIPVLWALKRSYRERLRKNAELAGAFDRKKAAFDVAPSELAALGDVPFAIRFRALVTDFYHEVETSYFTTIYNTSNSKLDFKSTLDRATKHLGEGFDPLRLMIGLEDLSHLRPLKDMHAVVRRGREQGALDPDDVEAYRTRWRHHGRKELDIRVPRWGEEPDYVRKMLQRGYDDFDGVPDPDAQERAQVESYQQAVDDVKRRLLRRPLLRRSLIERMELWRSYAWWREEMRDLSTQAYYLVRVWALVAADRMVKKGMLERPADVWALEYPEVIAALEGQRTAVEMRAQVARGVRLMDSYRHFDNPNEIGVGFGDREAVEIAEGALRGTPCSPGRVTGRVCVVRDLEDADRVEVGDILVTTFTDPGWTPLFSRIAGVVTETGGVLSHAAVIAREYGIPAVLAVVGATSRIVDGSTVILDGTAGSVESV